MAAHGPLIAVEIVLVFGGVLLFGWWQLRSIRKDQAAAVSAAARNPPPAPRAQPLEPAMNESTPAHPLDPGRIHADDPADVRYWCRELHCPEDALRRAVAEVGEHVTEVRRLLSEPSR